MRINAREVVDSDVNSQDKRFTLYFYGEEYEDLFRCGWDGDVGDDIIVLRMLLPLKEEPPDRVIGSILYWSQVCYHRSYCTRRLLVPPL